MGGLGAGGAASVPEAPDGLDGAALAEVERWARAPPGRAHTTPSEARTSNIAPWRSGVVRSPAHAPVTAWRIFIGCTLPRRPERVA